MAGGSWTGRLARPVSLVVCWVPVAARRLRFNARRLSVWAALSAVDNLLSKYHAGLLKAGKLGQSI